MDNQSIQNLREFYKTDLGQKLNNLITIKIKSYFDYNQNTLLIGYNNIDKKILTLSPAIQEGQSILSDINNLPLDNNSINQIIIIHAIEYIKDIELIIAEIERVLNYEGELLIFMVNKYPLFNILKAINTSEIIDQWHNLKKILQEKNLTITDTSGILFIKPWHSKITKAIDHYMGRHLGIRSGIRVLYAKKERTNNEGVLNFSFIKNVPCGNPA